MWPVQDIQDRMGALVASDSQQTDQAAAAVSAQLSQTAQTRPLQQHAVIQTASDAAVRAMPRQRPAHSQAVSSQTASQPAAAQDSAAQTAAAATQQASVQSQTLQAVAEASTSPEEDKLSAGETATQAVPVRQHAAADVIARPEQGFAAAQARMSDRDEHMPQPVTLVQRSTAMSEAGQVRPTCT